MRSIIGEKMSVADWLATGAGSGLISPAPGTWGSIFGLALGTLVYNAVGVWPLIILTIFYTVASFWAVHVVERDTGVHDSSTIVCDEIVAVWMVICFIPLNEPLWMLGAFIGFRALDILKPWPISRIDQNMGGAAGVMLDDILAALIVIFVTWGIYVGFNF